MRPMNWRIALPLALFVALLVAVGCGAPSSGVREGKKPKQYANIISLSPSTTEFLTDMGGGLFLVGRSASCDRPEEMQNVEVVVSDTKPNYERIAELKPDLIMYDKSLYSDDDIAKLKELGFELLELDATSVDKYADFGYSLGARMSIEMTTSRYLDKVYQALAAAVVKQTTNPRATVLLGDGSMGNYLVMGSESIYAELYTQCRATPVGVEGTKFQEVNIERLIDMDPEVIFSDGNAKAIYADPRLQSISAVKNQHVYDYNAKDLVRFGAKLNTLIEKMSDTVFRMPKNPPSGGAQ